MGGGQRDGGREGGREVSAVVRMKGGWREGEKRKQSGLDFICVGKE